MSGNFISSVHDLSDSEIRTVMEGIQSNESQGPTGMADPLEAQIVANLGRVILSPEPTLYADIRARYQALLS